MPHDPAANADRSSIYFATTDYHLKKIRAADGAVIWDVDIGPVYSTVPGWNVAVSADVVVVEKIDLFAYDSASGALRWNYRAPDRDEVGYSAITTDDSTIYAATARGRLYAVDARQGLSRWGVDLRRGDSTVFGLFPRHAGGAVYLCTHNGQRGTFWSVNVASGAINWSYDFQPEQPQQRAVCLGDPAFWRDLVIIPQSDGRVFAFDRASGAVRWIAPAATSVAWSDERWAASFGDNLIVTSQLGSGRIVALDPATGAERWRNANVPGSHLSNPVMDESSIYLSYGWTYAEFDATTGKKRWSDPPSQYGPPTVLFGRPVIGKDRIFLAGRDGSYALTK